jgi:hypothetical protein
MSSPADSSAAKDAAVRREYETPVVTVSRPVGRDQ